MKTKEPKFEKLVKTPERIELEMQYLRLCGVYDGPTIQQFVGDFKINPNATDKYKNNALMYALRPISYGVNKLNTIKTLCKMGVSPMRQNMFGFSPVSLAALAPGVYAFCSLTPLMGAQFSITLYDSGNQYSLMKGHLDHPKMFDFPYPIQLLDLSPEELALLQPNITIDLAIKTYDIKILQHSLFQEALTVLQDNFRTVHNDTFFTRYINVYRKKKVKLIVWGFGEDPIEGTEKEESD